MYSPWSTVLVCVFYTHTHTHINNRIALILVTKPADIYMHLLDISIILYWDIQYKFHSDIKTHRYQYLYHNSNNDNDYIIVWWWWQYTRVPYILATCYCILHFGYILYYSQGPTLSSQLLPLLPIIIYNWLLRSVLVGGWCPWEMEILWALCVVRHTGIVSVYIGTCKFRGCVC